MPTRTNGVLISEMNAQALADNLAELRIRYDDRLLAIERELATTRSLVQRQSQVIGEALARLYGSGPTEPDRG
jgi:hypothetical protein